MGKSIVFVTYNYWPPQFGGELLISIERFEGLAKQGFNIMVLTAGYPEFPSYQLRQGLHIYRSPVVGRNRLARLARRMIYLFWICWMLFHHSFEIYYQGDTAGIDIATSAIIVWLHTWIAHKKHARTFIVHSLADSESKTFDAHGWAGFWRRFMFGCFDIIVAVSPGLYQGLLPIFPKSARLIVNAVRDDVFMPIDTLSRTHFRQEQGINDTQTVFAFLGSVGYRKGFDILAQAFAGLALTHPDWCLWVIGPHVVQDSQNLDPKQVEEVTRALEPVEKQVIYWGRIDERRQLNQILSAADVFVFPSRREGFGVAPLEAMAAGLPVIVSRLPGITDLGNVEGDTGLFIQPGDSHSLKQAMLYLGERPDLRKKMGMASRQRILDGFGWTDYLKKWMMLYLSDQAEE